MTDRYRRRIGTLVESGWFTTSIMCLIFLNAVLIGMETYPAISSRTGALFGIMDRIIVAIFVVEITLRWVAWNPRKRFLLNGWNLFDFVIVAVALLPAAPYFTVLRIFRVLRILRVLRFVPGMSTLVVALLKSIPSLGNIFFFMIILFYVYGVIGTILFGELAPRTFGSLHRSFLTLFQVSTLEGWPDILLTLSEKPVSAWIYLSTFILGATFIILNLVVGVIVSNFQSAADPRPPDRESGPLIQQSELEDLKETLRRIEARISPPERRPGPVD